MLTVNMMLFTVLAMFTGCQDDEEATYFKITGDPTSLEVSAEGILKNYVVESNCDWQVVAQDASTTWVEASPTEGTGGDILKFIVKENLAAEFRTEYFAFIANGEEQPVLFAVTQEGSAPYFGVTNDLGEEQDKFSITGRSHTFKINTVGNVSKTYTIDADWLTVIEETEAYLILEAKANPSEENIRSANINFEVAEFSSLNQTVTIEQEPFEAAAIEVSNVNEFNEFDIEKAGGEVSLNVSSTVDWNYVFSENDWISVKEVTADKLVLDVSENATGVQRSVSLNLGFDEYDGGSEIKLIQYAGVQLVVENFDFTSPIVSVNSGGNPKQSEGTYYCFQTGPNYFFWGDDYATEGAVDRDALSWTTPKVYNTGGEDGAMERLFAGDGYVKLGQTNLCTELVFKQIAALEGLGEVKLKVRFKAVAYTTKTGTQPDGKLVKIESENAGTSSVSTFEINNYAVGIDQASVEADYPNVWNEDRAYNFTVSKATAETKIHFVAGEKISDGQNAKETTNRICFDDIIIEY